MISKIKGYFLLYIVGISIFSSLIPHKCLADNKLDANILNKMYSSRITDSYQDFVNNLKTSSPNITSSALEAQEYNIKQRINCSNNFQLQEETQGKGIEGLLDQKQVILVCQMASQEEVEAFENFLMTSDLEYYELANDNHKCALTNSDDNQHRIQCIFSFSITMNSLKKSYLRVLSDETQHTSGDDTSESKSDFLSLGMSDSTLIILLICVLLIILFGILVCLWMKKKKKRAQNIQGDKLVLIKTAASPRGSMPEVTSPMAQLNLPNQMFPTDPNTNLSPAHSLKSVPNIKLDGKGRSSEIQDENMFTNIDSPRSVSDASSRTSAKNAPKALDFNIEFSMVEQESVIRMKNNLKDKKKEY